MEMDYDISRQIPADLKQGPSSFCPRLGIADGKNIIADSTILAIKNIGTTDGKHKTQMLLKMLKNRGDNASRQ